MRFKNEVTVGIVVVVALLILGIGGFWLTGRPWSGGQRELIASFREVGLLANGSPVKYRGVRIGRVELIELDPRGQGVFVTMSVDPAVVLPDDAAVVLSAESFFGDWQAALVSQAAFPDEEFTIASTPGMLPGAALPDITQLTAVAARIAGDIQLLSDRVQIAFTEETAVKIRQTVDNIQEASEQLSGFLDQQTESYAQVARNVVATSENFRRTSASADRVVNQLGATFTEGEVQQILANAKQASENLRVLSEQLSSAAGGVPGLLARADTTLTSIGRTADVAGEVVQGFGAQAEGIGPTIAEAQQAMATLNRALQKLEQGDGTIGRLLEDPALYEETQRSIVTLRRLLADLQANPGRYIGEINLF
ncbi:MAG: MlaD family protein [Gemmatimonadota bacterium]|nr:MlaD family protein [Gemmatimonadota bacterium]